MGATVAKTKHSSVTTPFVGSSSPRAPEPNNIVDTPAESDPIPVPGEDLRLKSSIDSIYYKPAQPP